MHMVETVSCVSRCSPETSKPTISTPSARRCRLVFNEVKGENAGPATCSGGSGPGDLERTLPLLRAGPAVFEQRVVGNLSLAMCLATECRSVERALVNLFPLRYADRTRP